MHRIIRVSCASFLTAVPLVALAATGATLDDAINAWTDIEQENVSAGQIDAEDELLESSSTLFPYGQSSSSLSPIDEQREQRTGAFVTVTIDGLPVTFADVPRDTWFAPYVRDIAEKAIVSGYRGDDGKPLGTFGPADPVTIEQLAKVTIGASSNMGDCFSGIPVNLTASGTWSAGYIACTEQLHWTVYGDGSVDVHRPATRAEVVVTLLEAFNVAIAEPTGTAFTDVTASTQFNSVIEQAKNDGIVSGYTDEDGNLTGLFGPDEPVTRAEFSKMVTLAMQVYTQ